jgi:hypothetical protein
MAIPFAVSVAALAAVVLVATPTWVSWFTVPGLDPAPRLATAIHDGAVLWRIMLVVSAVMLVGTPLLLTRMCPPAAIPPVDAGGPDARERWILMGLIVAGLLVRAPRLVESLWYDEIAAWISYGRHGPGVIIGSYFDPSNHIGHTLLTWLSVELVPSAGAEMSLRLPALLASLVSIVAVHGLVRRAGGPAAAIVAATLMAVLPVPVLEGVEARGYSMMICLAAVSSWSLLAALDRGTAWRWVVYAVLCAAGAWAHPLTVFVPVGHGIWLVWRRSIPGLLSLVLAAVITVTLYAPVVPQVLAIRDTFTVSGDHQPTLLGPEGLHTLLQLGGAWYAWAALPGLVLLAIGFGAGIRKTRLRETIAVSWLGLPVYLVVVIATQQWMYARFALFAIPGAMLLMATGLVALHQWRRPAALVAGAAVLAVSIADLVVRPPKQPLRDAADFVAATGEGQRVVVVGLHHQVFEVYAQGMNVTYSLQHGRDLEERLRADTPFWVVLYYPESVADETLTLLEVLGFEQIAQFDGWVDWSNGDVLVYRRITS